MDNRQPISTKKRKNLKMPSKAKRLKFAHNGMDRRTKEEFLLEINGNSSSNLNRDSNLFSTINYDLRKDQIDLFGFWSVGISGFIAKFNSWKNIAASDDLPSLSFVKMCAKFVDEPTKIIGIFFFRKSHLFKSYSSSANKYFSFGHVD